MSLNAGKILKISITIDGKEKILEEIQKYLSQTSGKGVKPLIIVTPNPEQIVYAQSHPPFATVLNRAGVALPDGIGLVWASRFRHAVTIRRRIPGVEFMEDLAKEAADRGYRVGLIGGTGGLAVRAFECLQQKYPKLEGWAEVPEALDLKEFAKKIQSTGTRVIFVGLGAPKQEYFIDRLNSILSLRAVAKQSRRNRHALRVRDDSQPVVLMAVGGSFDIIARRLKRAPLFIRSIGFEWAWRLFQEPWRWKRQLALITFLWFVLRDQIFSDYTSCFS